MNKFVASTLACLLAAGTAVAAEELDREAFDSRLNEAGVFGEWDADSSGVIDENEFATGSENWGGDEELAFGDWDANGDSGIDENEFGESAWTTLDDDESGTLAENEWGDWEEDGLF